MQGVIAVWSLTFILKEMYLQGDPFLVKLVVSLSMSPVQLSVDSMFPKASPETFVYVMFGGILSSDKRSA